MDEEVIRAFPVEAQTLEEGQVGGGQELQGLQAEAGVDTIALQVVSMPIFRR